MAATEAIKPVVGPYYREPAKSGWWVQLCTAEGMFRGRTGEVFQEQQAGIACGRVYQGAAGCVFGKQQVECLGWGKLCLVQDRLCLWQTGGAGAGQAMLCVRQGVAGATMCSLPFLASLTSPFSPCRFPTHLIAPLVKSFKHDHYVDDTGNVLYYKEDPNFSNAKGEFHFFAVFT